MEKNNNNCVMHLYNIVIFIHNIFFRCLLVGFAMIFGKNIWIRCSVNHPLNVGAAMYWIANFITRQKKKQSF